MANDNNTEYKSNPFQFVATIKNSGNASLTNVKARLILPDGLSADELTYDIGSMSKGSEINHIWNLTAAKFGTQTTLTYQIELTADQLSEPVTETYTLKLPALHTVHTAGAVIPDTAPTCTSSGVGHTVCTICGGTLGENIYIPALGHDYKVSESKEATCT